MDKEEIEFSFQDLKHGVSIPNSITKEVAYETGIHIGDGWMNITHAGRFKTPQYRVSYIGNLLDELSFHKDIIAPLVHRIYNKRVSLVKRLDNTCETKFKSKAVVSFKSKILQLPKGTKSVLKGVPSAITNESDRHVRECVKGISDTDFSLAFLRKHREVHYYPKIRYASSNKDLVRDLGYWLGEIFDFDLTSCYDTQRIDTRSGRTHITHTLEINGRAMLEKWMNEIGFRNEKHMSKYRLWKKFGFCPSRTTTPERILMLDGEIDPHSYYEENVRTEPLSMPSGRRFQLLKESISASRIEFSSRDTEKILGISFRRSKGLLKKWHEEGLLYRRWEQNENVGRFLYRFGS